MEITAAKYPPSVHNPTAASEPIRIPVTSLSGRRPTTNIQEETDVPAYYARPSALGKQEKSQLCVIFIHPYVQVHNKHKHIIIKGFILQEITIYIRPDQNLRTALSCTFQE